MLWMYWQNDKYWGPNLPKEWHRAWIDGGGLAEFHQFSPSGGNGHSGWNRDFDAWLPVVDRFLREPGFTRDVIVERPSATAWSALNDLDKVPVNARGKSTYQQFISMPLPRAFAVGEHGGFGYATGEYAWGRALGYCRRSGQTCTLYAVDEDIVYVEPHGDDARAPSPRSPLPLRGRGEHTE